jgi:hypothetical protein
MKTTKLLTVLFLFIFNYNLFGLDTLSLKFYPLHVGDFWTYKIHYFSNAGYHITDTTYKIKPTVLSSVVKNNHIYYVIRYYGLLANMTYMDTVRVDSISGSIREFRSVGYCNNYLNEILLDSLKAIIGDSVKSCDSYISSCIQIDSSNIFNSYRKRKTFLNDDVLYFYYNKYYFIEGLGFVYKYEEIVNATHHSWYSIETDTLIGCKINGIIFGDTSMVFIKNISNTLPSSFSLSQNYPNPFNPSTSIKYQIANSKLVTLKIYDILGKEIAILVNEKQSPGTYKVNWDASAFPSGIYLYKLNSGDYSETKKMLLIK